ncbi:MAG: DUF885 family protein [Vicinamibacteria bacterium]
MTRKLPALLALACLPAAAWGQPAPARARDAAQYAVSAAEAAAVAASELAPLVARYTADRDALLRLWSVPGSATRREKLRGFYGGWLGQVDALGWDRLSLEGRVDAVLLRRHLAYEIGLLDREEARGRELAPLLPFADAIAGLQESRRMLEDVEPRAAAAALERVAAEAQRVSGQLEAAPEAAPAPDRKPPSAVVARRAAMRIGDLREALDDWFKHYDGYDPGFSWWTREPMKRATAALDALRKTLREDVVGAKPGQDEPIVGDPIGREALLADLSLELIPYSPEELVTIAERQFAWCEAEMKKASREMGMGDDWKRALEKVRGMTVEPGRQPALVRDLAREAIDFLRARDLVTLPPLAAEVWRMEMMPPERQKVNPFFLGGEVIQVSYPTDTMPHEDKLNSLRANNGPFARATVHHELVPGHHLQGFMNDRYNPHRLLFGTPFSWEGWALYWEFLLWDQGFPRTPEDRVGMLFWRMHRCARIIFSLSFHLGRFTPQQCIDFLVDRVGHERWTATGEVRRSLAGDYSPLYQASYMLGGLQFYALQRQLVGGGRMTNRQFHDRILREGPIPVELVRAILTDAPPARDFKTAWRFADQP